MQDICMDKPNSTFYRLALRLTLSYIATCRQFCLPTCLVCVFDLCVEPMYYNSMLIRLGMQTLKP
jgi:hypothetical protein